MNKKQLAAFVDSLVDRILAKANATEGDEPKLEEVEARTLLGIYLRKNAGSIVDAIVVVEETEEKPAEVAEVAAS